MNIKILNSKNSLDQIHEHINYSSVVKKERDANNNLEKYKQAHINKNKINQSLNTNLKDNMHALQGMQIIPQRI